MKMSRNIENHKPEWVEPELEEIGSAIDLIQESKWEGFDDGARLNGITPIGPST